MQSRLRRRSGELWGLFANGLALAGALGLAAAAPSASAAGPPHSCSKTAAIQYDACTDEADAGAATARAVCTNVSGDRDRGECFDGAKADVHEARALCREQRAARLDVCAAVGEERYDPDFDPAHFDTNFAHPAHPNPYFPVRVGNRWTYRGGGEKIEIGVVDETKSIEGVTCAVVHDFVTVDGDVVEDTDDWFGQRKDGTVDYCGEISQTLEVFAGDDPNTPELVSLEGSWKTGRDGAQSGTVFPGTPVVGAVYRQEFLPGTAEDLAQVVSTHYAFGREAELDFLVPRALARLLCSAGDCVVTAEFSPLHPGALEHKYYARGIGLFLEVTPDSREVVKLVDCNFDTRCNALP